MFYKAIINQETSCIRPKTISDNVHKSDSWEGRTLIKRSSLIVTTVLFLMITGLFASPQTLPNIRGSVSLSYNPEDAVYIDIKLYDANNNNLISQLCPDPDGSFIFSTSAGSYYLTIEMFRPDLGKFTYPITTQDIHIPNTSYCHDFGTIQVERYSMNMVIVSSDLAYPYFKSIDHALDKILSAVNNGYNGNTVTLYVFPGNYYWPQTNLQYEGSFSYTNAANDALTLVIRGAGSGAIIEPNYGDYYTFNISRTNISFQNIKFSRASNNWNYHLFFRGTNNSSYSFTGCLFGKHNTSLNYTSSTSFLNQSGISLKNCSIMHNNNFNNGCGVLKFENCSNIEIDNCNFSFNVSFMGGATYFSQSNNVQVRNSLFEYNYSLAPESEIPAGTPGGAMYIASSTNVNIATNRFLHNTTTGTGGTVYVNSVSPIRIEGNLFRDNIMDQIGLIYTKTDALGFDNCTFTTNDYISHNIIHSGFEVNSYSSSPFITIGIDCSGTLNISNAVFIKGNLDTNEYKSIISAYSPVNMNFTNCIFQTRDVDADFQNATHPPQPATISVSYSLFDNDFTGVTNANHNTCNVSDMGLDSNYIPIWNQTTMSPCIDTGTGANDPDGTPADIGAIRAGDHKYEEYTMPGPNAIKWMSFPVLNRITDGYCMNGNFFDTILNPVWLDVIKYKPNNCLEKEIIWGNGDWANLTEDVSSLQGYKIMMTPNAPTDLMISTPGHLQAPHTVIPLSQGENWLGYFQETSSKPLDALAPILSYIDLIQTQNWTMIKVPGWGWIHSNNWVINYGDMVIVNALQACSFTWNNTHLVDPKIVAKATAFAYTEKMDYTPFYITIPDAKSVDMPTEIGLYVNGICKGASVVEEELTHICAYLEDDEEITPENADLVFFYSSKSIPQNKSIYKLSDGQLQYNREGITYYSIEIKDMGHVVPAPQEVMLSQNYPNPFNPSTTISYSLPEDGLVELNIYNMKGQLVQTLLHEHQGIGTHRVVWNGKDSNANSCSTGMYFYKLTFNGKSIIKKMLIMK